MCLALVPEAEFSAQYGDAPVKLSVLIPASSEPGAAAWGLAGQTLEVRLSVGASGRELKEALGALLGGMPVNKQQIRRRDRPDLGFLKDTQSLASLNIGDHSALEMTVRSRGGKK